MNGCELIIGSEVAYCMCGKWETNNPIAIRGRWLIHKKLEGDKHGHLEDR